MFFALELFFLIFLHYSYNFLITQENYKLLTLIYDNDSTTLPTSAQRAAVSYEVSAVLQEFHPRFCIRPTILCR